MSSTLLCAPSRASLPGLILLSTRAPFQLCAAHQTGGTPIALVFDLPTLVQDASRHCCLHVHCSSQLHPLLWPLLSVRLGTVVPSICNHNTALGCTRCELLMHLLCSSRRLSGAACTICLAALGPCQLHSLDAALHICAAGCGLPAAQVGHSRTAALTGVCCICFPGGLPSCLSGRLGVLHLWQCCSTCHAACAPPAGHR